MSEMSADGTTRSAERDLSQNAVANWVDKRDFRGLEHGCKVHE